MTVYTAMRFSFAEGTYAMDYFYMFKTRAQAEEFVTGVKDDEFADPDSYWEIKRSRATHRSGAFMAVYHLKKSRS